MALNDSYVVVESTKGEPAGKVRAQTPNPVIADSMAREILKDGCGGSYGSTPTGYVSRTKQVDVVTKQELKDHY